MTTKLGLFDVEKNVNQNCDQPEEGPFEFYRPNLMLKLEDIIEELYTNPGRGKFKDVPIKGWNGKFKKISQDSLLLFSPESAITSFNNKGIRMDFFEDINEVNKAKLLENL